MAEIRNLFYIGFAVDQYIVTGTSIQDILAIAADQGVVTGITRQQVIT